MEAQREGFRAHVFKAVALLLGAAALYLFVLALSSPLHTIRAHSLPLLALVLAAGAVGWLGWREERAERRRAAGREAAARERIDTELRREDGSGELHARIEELEREPAWRTRRAPVSRARATPSAPGTASCAGRWSTWTAAADCSATRTTYARWCCTSAWSCS